MGDGIIEAHYPGRMARYGDLFLVDAHVTDPESQDPIDLFLPLIRRMLRERGRGSVCVQIRSGSKSPPDETRDKIRDFLATEASRMTAVAVVLEGSGFWLAMFRAVLGTLINANRAPIKIQVCANVADAIAHFRKTKAFGADSESDAMREFYASAPGRTADL